MAGLPCPQSIDGGGELADRVGDDVGDRPDGVDAPDDLAAEGERRLHVAAEVERLGVAELAEDVVLGVLQGLGALRAQGPQGGGVAVVQEEGVGLGGGDDRLLPVVVDRRLQRRHHAGAHLHALGAEGEGGRHRRPVDDAAGGDDRHVDARADEGQQHHRRHGRRALEAAALAALDDEPVDAGVDRLQRRGQRRHDVVHGEAGAA